MLCILAGEDIHLKLDLRSGQSVVSLESAQLEQVLMNLVTNARDAMPSGGNIEIETSIADLDEEAAAAYAGLKPGRYVRLLVSDNGHGIPLEIQPHIFEPFFTTKERGKGTGLGLSTVFGIVRQCDGHISCESSPGQGTTFRIYLPVAEGQIQIAAPELQLGPKKREGAEAVLLVEDEPALRGSVRRILEQNGHKVLEASDALEALRIIENHDGQVALLMTDVMMPHMRGTELAQLVGERYPQMKVLYISGYAEDAVCLNGHHFIQKPFKREVLTRKVREVLDR